MNKEEIINSIRKILLMNTNIQISDNKSLEIDNCKKIIEYNDIYVKIKTVNMYVEVWGRDLSIDDFNTCGIEIKGTITNIEISKK